MGMGMGMPTTAAALNGGLARNSDGIVLRQRCGNGGLFLGRYHFIGPRGNAGRAIDIHVAERFHVLACARRAFAGA